MIQHLSMSLRPVQPRCLPPSASPSQKQNGVWATELGGPKEKDKPGVPHPLCSVRLRKHDPYPPPLAPQPCVRACERGEVLVPKAGCVTYRTPREGQCHNWNPGSGDPQGLGGCGRTLRISGLGQRMRSPGLDGPSMALLRRDL